jgi:hypothetical protein
MCIFFQVNHIVNAKGMPKMIFHVGSVIVTIGVCLWIYVYDKIGKNRFGTCSQKFSGSGEGWVAVLISGLMLAGGIFVLAYVYNKLPNTTQEMKVLKSEFLGYGEVYIWSLMFFLGCGAISTVMAGDIKRYQLGYTGPKEQSVIFHVAEVLNSIKFIMGLVLFTVRVQDPAVYRVYQSWLARREERKRSKLGLSNESDKNESLAGLDAQNTLEMEMSKGIVAVDGDDMNWLSDISSNLRAAFTRTMTAFIGKAFNKFLKGEGQSNLGA